MHLGFINLMFSTNDKHTLFPGFFGPNKCGEQAYVVLCFIKLVLYNLCSQCGFYYVIKWIKFPGFVCLQKAYENAYCEY